MKSLKFISSTSSKHPSLISATMYFKHKKVHWMCLFEWKNWLWEGEDWGGESFVLNHGSFHKNYIMSCCVINLMAMIKMRTFFNDIVWYKMKCGDGSESPCSEFWSKSGIELKDFWKYFHHKRKKKLRWLKIIQLPLNW